MTLRLLHSLGTGILGLGLALSAQAQTSEVAPPPQGPVNVVVGESQATVARGGLLYDNGPLINSPGTGAGGADESVLQTASLMMNQMGFGHQVSADNRVADDFTVGALGWEIQEIIFFAYQTNSTTTSTMTAVNFRIWDGPPNLPGSTVVFGDDTTNRLVASTWSGIYRVTETTSGATNRPIMSNSTTGGTIVLTPGTYWIDWQTGGTLASGPWVPPVTITGTCTTGNALQFSGGINAWVPVVDDRGTPSGADDCAQDLPFQIIGTEIPVELVSFDGLVDGSSVTLAWETASETNNAGFEVQMDRVGDAAGFEAVSFVDGHGTTTEAQTYGHTVTDLAPGTYAFRLKQIDFDGAFEYSDEVEATIEVVGTHVLTDAYPNPFNPQATFTFAASQAQAVTAVLYNALGQRVAVLFDGSVEADQTQTVSINGAGLSSGLYVVRVEGERFSDALRVTLLK